MEDCSSDIYESVIRISRNYVEDNLVKNKLSNEFVNLVEVHTWDVVWIHIRNFNSLRINREE